MKRTETCPCKYSYVNFSPFSVYSDKLQKMCSPSSPFPFWRPVLATQSLLSPQPSSSTLGLRTPAQSTAWCPPRPPSLQDPVPCSLSVPRAVPALCPCPLGRSPRAPALLVPLRLHDLLGASCVRSKSGRARCERLFFHRR